MRLRSRRIGAGEQLLEIRVDALEEARAERLSHRLLRSREVRDLVYRALDGTAGLHSINANWRGSSELAAVG